MRRLPNPGDRLAEIVIQRGLAEPEAVESALADSRRTGRSLVRILTDRAVVDAEQLARTLAGGLGLELVQLDDVRIHPRVLERIPREVAGRLGVLPYAVKRQDGGEVLYLATSDPLDDAALDEVRRLVDGEVQPMVASAPSLNRAIERQYRGVATRAVPPGLVVGSGPAVGALGAANEEVRLVRGRPSSTAGSANPPRGGRDPDDAARPRVPSAPPSFGASISDDLIEGPGAFEEATIDMDASFRSMVRGESGKGTLPAGPTPGASSTEGSSARRGWSLSPLEIPVDPLESDHPFGDWAPSSVPVGLGETGIIPDVGPDEEPFEPPPPEELPTDPQARRNLAFGSDIPISSDQVQARSGSELEAFDAIEAIEEVELDPLEDGSPELEILELRSADEPEDEALVRAALTGAVGGRRSSPSDAQSLVERLVNGDGLESGERERLVLALGRLLIRAGVIDRSELERELDR